MPRRAAESFSDEIREKLRAWNRVLPHCIFAHQRIILKTRIAHAETIIDGLHWLIEESRVTLAVLGAMTLCWREALDDQRVDWTRLARSLEHRSYGEAR